jgi:hypothetical protein
MSEWPFTSPPNLGVITLNDIVQESAPILQVSHDADDGAWQFLGSGAPNWEETTVVRLQKVVAIDPTLNELADLPLGWRAWRRAKSEPWVREPMAA